MAKDLNQYYTVDFKVHNDINPNNIVMLFPLEVISERLKSSNYRLMKPIINERNKEIYEN